MVKIVGAPGFEDFEATYVPGLEAVVRRDGHTVAVVVDNNNEIFVFDVKYVFGE
jgi:hypothetical protein